MKIKIAKVIYKLAIFSRWYKYWSKLYRFLFQRKHDNIILPLYRDINKLDEQLSRLEYEKDGFKELWDSCGTPQNVQFKLDNPHLAKGALDCDDFAVYAANTYAPKETEFVFLYSVAYTDNNSKFGFSGHMICCVYDVVANTYTGLGNWNMFTVNSYKELVDYIRDDDDFIGATVFNPKTLSAISTTTNEYDDIIKQSVKKLHGKK